MRPLVGSQMRTVWSALPVASMVPLGLNASVLIPRTWPVSFRSERCFATSHSVTVLSQEPMASSRPRPNAIDEIWPPIRKPSTRFPVRAFHTITSPQNVAPARSLPSRLNAALGQLAPHGGTPSELVRPAVREVGDEPARILEQNGAAAVVPGGGERLSAGTTGAGSERGRATLRPGRSRSTIPFVLTSAVLAASELRACRAQLAARPLEPPRVEELPVR